MEWAHAIAPGAALLVVEASSQSLHSMVNAVKAARGTPGVDVISMSWAFQRIRQGGGLQLGVHDSGGTPGHHVRGGQWR